jgi:hypothetical protein
MLAVQSDGAWGNIVRVASARGCSTIDPKSVAIGHFRRVLLVPRGDPICVWRWDAHRVKWSNDESEMERGG